MKIKKMKFEKGTYRFQQIAGFVSVRDYMFVTVENKRHLLIRFFSDLPFAVDYIEYVINQIDEFGVTLAKTKQVKDKITLHGGSEYVTQDAVEVSDRCVDVSIEIKEVRSGNYSYTFENGVLKDRYLQTAEPIVETRGKSAYLGKCEYLKIKEKKLFDSGKMAYIPLLALIALIGGVVIVEMLSEFIPIWMAELKQIIIALIERLKAK